MAKADLRFPENDIERTARLIRAAIDRTGMTISEASALCDVKDEAQFRRMVAGKEKFNIHLLLTEKARPIWCELMAVTARVSGYTVERVIRWTETA
jgi:hypothetical protein